MTDETHLNELVRFLEFGGGSQDANRAAWFKDKLDALKRLIEEPMAAPSTFKALVILNDAVHMGDKRDYVIHARNVLRWQSVTGEASATEEE